MFDFKVGRAYLALDYLRHRPWWSNKDGYEVFKDDEEGMYTIDGDGYRRELCNLDSSAEVVHTLENE